jgi:hypothetical protein
MYAFLVLENDAILNKVFIAFLYERLPFYYLVAILYSLLFLFSIHFFSSRIDLILIYKILYYYHKNDRKKKRM